MLSQVLLITDQARPRKAQGYRDNEREAERYAAKLRAKAEIIVGSANKIYGTTFPILCFRSVKLMMVLVERQMEVEIEE
jgi:hypothetical protein